MSLPNPLKGVPKRVITKLSRMRMPQNFAWVVAWDITYKCNLKCRYCQFWERTLEANTKKSSEKVAQLRPKYLIITGGEPLLVPDIADLTRKTYFAAGEPFLIVNTNTTVHLERLFENLDIINTVHLSLDGLGEFNSVNRGVSGDIILENIKRIDAEIKRRQTKTAVLTMTVVTTKNYEHIPEMVRKVMSEVKGVYMSIGSVEPYWSELSIIKDDQKLRWLVNELKPLADEYPEHLILVGALAPENYLETKSIGDNAFKMHQGREFVHCKRQFFRVTVAPDGEVMACKPSIYYEYYHERIRSEIKKKHYVEALKYAWKLIDQLVIHPSKSYCPFPCKCEEFLDDILSNVNIPEIDLIAGLFTREELLHASRFCQNAWNEPLTEETIERLMKGLRQGTANTDT